MKVPIVSLALARCPLPPPRELSPDLAAARGAAAKGGAAVKCVVVVAADSSVGVLDAATGFPLSRRVFRVYITNFAQNTIPVPLFS
jgi:hypothetical protein